MYYIERNMIFTVRMEGPDIGIKPWTVPKDK